MGDNHAQDFHSLRFSVRLGDDGHCNGRDDRRDLRRSDRAAGQPVRFWAAAELVEARQRTGRRRGDGNDRRRSSLNDDARTDADPAVEVPDVFVEHADAAVGNEMADGVRLVGAVNGVLAAA